MQVFTDEALRCLRERDEPPTAYPLLRQGMEVGGLGISLAELAPALDTLETLLRSPASLALLLEAAGPTALARAGQALGLRLVAAEDVEED